MTNPDICEFVSFLFYLKDNKHASVKDDMVLVIAVRIEMKKIVLLQTKKEIREQMDVSSHVALLSLLDEYPCLIMTFFLKYTSSYPC